MNTHYTASLDLGSRKIRMALASINAKNQNEIIAISEHRHKGISRGRVVNIDETVKAIKACVNDIFKQTGIQIDKVNVNFNGRFLKLTKKRLSFDLEAKAFESDNFAYIRLIKQTHPNLFEENVEILQVKPVTTTLANKNQTIIDLNIITGHRTTIQNVKTTLKRAGLELNELLPDPLPASYSVLTSKEKEEGVVLVDIGQDTTNLAFFHQNMIQEYFTFPVGGNVINRELIDYYHLSYQQAEILKRHFGNKALKKSEQKEDNKIMQSINANTKDKIYLQDVHKTIQTITREIVNVIFLSCKNLYPENTLRHAIVITGGAAKLKGLDFLIKEMTKQEVRLGIPFWDDKIKADHKFEDPSNAAVLGSVLAYLNQNTSN